MPSRPDRPATTHRTAGVILAAGASRRLGRPKQLLPYGDGVLLDAVIARHGLGKAVSSMDDMAAEVQQYARSPAAWAAASQTCLAYMDTHYGDDQVLVPYLEALRPVGR